STICGGALRVRASEGRPDTVRARPRATATKATTDRRARACRESAATRPRSGRLQGFARSAARADSDLAHCVLAVGAPRQGREAAVFRVSRARLREQIPILRTACSRWERGDKGARRPSLGVFARSASARADSDLAYHSGLLGEHLV